MAKMKEQKKNPEKELNETEITNLSDAEFKTDDRYAQRNPPVWQHHKGRNEVYTK